MLVLLVIGVPLNATDAVSLSPSHAPCLVGSPKGATCMTCIMGLIEEKEAADVVVVSWWCQTAASCGIVSGCCLTGDNDVDVDDAGHGADRGADAGSWCVVLVLKMCCVVVAVVPPPVSWFAW